MFIDNPALSASNLMTKYLISKATEWVSEKDQDTEPWRASSSPQESKADESQMTGCFRVSPTGGTPRKGSEHADCMDFSMLGLCPISGKQPTLVLVWETGPKGGGILMACSKEMLGCSKVTVRHEETVKNIKD